MNNVFHTYSVPQISAQIACFFNILGHIILTQIELYFSLIKLYAIMSCLFLQSLMWA